MRLNNNQHHTADSFNYARHCLCLLHYVCCTSLSGTKHIRVETNEVYGPVKVNQRMAFFVVEMDFFSSGFQIQFGLEPGN